MNALPPGPHQGYDAFLSHNHRDKAWVRALAARLAASHWNGRPLRPWLDEQFLDPGNLGQQAELTTALDRSRHLVLVLSPAAAASAWVGFELAHVLARRPRHEVIVLQLAPCALPEGLAGSVPISFVDPAPAAQDAAFAELLARLCPAGGATVAAVCADVDSAWQAALDSGPGGLDATPSAPREALCATLLRQPIDTPAGEGLALAAMRHVGQRLLQASTQGHPAAYNLKMLLGECLALALLRHPRWRAAQQAWLHGEAADPPGSADPVLAFAVLRAEGKLAEIDAARVDAGVLLRVAARLDAVPALAAPAAATAMLLGRVVARLRGSDLGDLLITALAEGGAASRIAAIGAVSLSALHAPALFYLPALAERQAAEQAARQADGRAAAGGALAPPSRRLQALLWAIDLDQPPLVRQQLDLARADLRRAWGLDDLPCGHSWFALRREAPPPPPPLPQGALAGRVRLATPQNMVALADQVGPQDLVCLNGPRIVDSLFDAAGALLIADDDDASAPLALRLQGRGVPHAALPPARLAALRDGDLLQIDSQQLRRVVASV